MIKHLIGLIFIAYCLTGSVTYANKVEVKVGGYLFPPFVEMDGQNHSGLTIDLIALLNQQQSEFNFSFTPTSPKRRYTDFERQVFDAIFFENINWSWKQYNLAASQVFLSGGEVFFTHNIEGRNRDFFKTIKDKKIVAILGYHYQFLDNITDTRTLKKKFNIRLVNSPQTVINQVINNKAQIGIAPYSYLQQQTKINPQLIETLLINDTFDQHYEHTILIRKTHPLSIQRMNELLNQIQRNGTLPQLLAKYGLTPLKP